MFFKKIDALSYIITEIFAAQKLLRFQKLLSVLSDRILLGSSVIGSPSESSMIGPVLYTPSQTALNRQMNSKLQKQHPVP